MSKDKKVPDKDTIGINTYNNNLLLLEKRVKKFEQEESKANYLKWINFEYKNSQINLKK